MQANVFERQKLTGKCAFRMGQTRSDRWEVGGGRGGRLWGRANQSPLIIKKTVIKKASVCFRTKLGISVDSKSSSR